jgi:aerobic carbon-monoxide dehydrogenase large subunit
MVTSNGQVSSGHILEGDAGITATTRYTVCDDFGRAVNPLLLEGQVHGGVI